MNIKILIDSASDISIYEAKELGIELIPLKVSFGEKEYLDGVDLLPKQFYEKLIETDELPKTSQITPDRFLDSYEKLTSDGSQLLVITISSKLSNTYNSAVLASQEYKDKVFVVDSLNAAVGERLLCEYAIRLIKQGFDMDLILRKLNKAKHRIKLIAVVGTLEYLKNGGRITKTVAFVGEVLSIKPVIAIQDGEVKLVGKARGSKRANNLLNELISSTKGIDFKMPVGAVYTGLSDATLNKYIEDQRFVWEPYVDEVPKHIVGSTIGTHVGPGALGVAFFEKE